MLIREEYVNATEGHRFGDSGEPYATFTDDIGKLFRSLQRENGRCVSKVYIDTKSAGTVQVGWVFQKREAYERCRGKQAYYIRETWVTLYDECEPDDPLACVTQHKSGAITRRPFKVRYF